MKRQERHLTHHRDIGGAPTIKSGRRLPRIVGRRTALEWSEPLNTLKRVVLDYCGEVPMINIILYWVLAGDSLDCIAANRYTILVCCSLPLTYRPTSYLNVL